MPRFAMRLRMLSKERRSDGTPWYTPLAPGRSPACRRDRLISCDMGYALQLGCS